jgi:hypothetical protein
MAAMSLFGAIECEIHEGEEHKEHVPEELLNCPVKANQTVDDETIHNCLEEHVWDLNKNLFNSQDYYNSEVG